MATKRCERKSAVEKVIKRYVELASHIPEVCLILYEEESTGGRCIWTVIDAPRSDSNSRYQVYEAERAAMPPTLEPPVDFRLSNIRDFEDRTVDYYVRPEDRVLFLREASS